MKPLSYYSHLLGLGFHQRLAQRRKHRFYRRVIQPGQLVFDVGANDGDWTKVFLSLGARVVAVEPQEMPIDARATIERIALGAEAGTAKMRMTAPGASGLATLSEWWVARLTASGRFAVNKWSGTVTVPVTTLDNLIEKHGRPNYIKIDAEGYDDRVLAGLSTPIALVSCEVAREALEVPERCIARLQQLDNYEFAFSEADNFRLSAWQTPNSVMALLRNLPPLGWGDLFARCLHVR